MAHNALELPRRQTSGVVGAAVRLTAVQLKAEIHDSGICNVALEMAIKGKRPVFHKDEDGKEVIQWEELSEGAHIDMIKFIVKKVLPDAKEYDSVDDRKALDKWADLIESEGQSTPAKG